MERTWIREILFNTEKGGTKMLRGAEILCVLGAFKNR